MYWMELPFQYRKDLSHEGAVKTEHRYHPVHGWCEHMRSCWFDPSNAVYAMVLGAICPAISRTGWNDETIGDICEAWLAIGARSELVVAKKLAKIINDVSQVMYLIADELNIYDLRQLDEWVCQLLSLIHI